MVHETVQRAPKQIMEVLHAVHDAEYDKALHNYQTQKRQWENHIQGNLNLFDPYAHQNIVVLYTVVCTATTIPCAGPELLALAFYNEHETSRDFDPDCTLGQYVEDLCLSTNTICTSNGCERKMSEHHRTYVHGEARITVFVEKSACKIKGLQDSILMWSYCKICKKETQVMPMSESTWKYSLGKYLELSFWSSELRLRAGFCPHNLHRDHLRYFGYRNVAIRIH
jgi:1-phosphatidylinositol-3-phosphate 5-kinase